MVTLGSKRIQLAFTDSRGFDLDHRIRKINSTGELFEIQAYKGATFEEIVASVEGYLPKHPFDVVYIMGGACNVTTKDQFTGHISYDWGHGDRLKENLVNTLKSTDIFLRKHFLATKIIFCPLVGTELARVVNCHVITGEDQEAVEEAVWEFNSTIFDINKERGTYSPALHHQIHRFCKGKKRTYYQHLRDGLHPTDHLKDIWAKEFCKAMAHN